MSSLSDVRRLGATVGAFLGLVLTALAVAFTNGDNATATRGLFPVAMALAVPLGWLATALAVPLGWLFARRAVAPGKGAWLTSAVGITVAAVPSGSLLMAVLVAVGTDGLSAVEAAGGIVVVMILSLALFGLPLALMTFCVASIWIGLLRVVVRLLRVDAQARSNRAAAGTVRDRM